MSVEIIKENNLDASCLSKSKVAILLCTYNGQLYLDKQLNSFVDQTHSNWEVWASDDGSTDNTRAILETYRQKWPQGRLLISDGPATGFVDNFLSLTCRIDIEADYYAYSDQDDVWESDKLERAVRWLETVPSNIPALYCSRTCLIDDDANEIGLSSIPSQPLSFANALVENIAGGNTMVFNNAARMIVREAGEKLAVAVHDWWLYMVVTGCGGVVFYDANSTLRYRQHNGNLIGNDATWAGRLDRIRVLWHGQHRTWNDEHIKALRKLQNRLTAKNRNILDCFAKAREQNIVLRVLQLKRCGLYRQKMLGNLSLLLAAVFNKL